MSAFSPSHIFALDSNIVPPKCQFSCLTLKRLDWGSHSPHFRRPWLSQQSQRTPLLVDVGTSGGAYQVLGAPWTMWFPSRTWNIWFVLSLLNSPSKGIHLGFLLKMPYFYFWVHWKIFFHYSEVSSRVLRQAMTNFNRRNRETLKENTLKPNAGYNIYIFFRFLP